jgi:hypothetical protein
MGGREGDRESGLKRTSPKPTARKTGRSGGWASHGPPALWLRATQPGQDRMETKHYTN